MSVVDPALAHPVRPAFAIPGEAIKAGGTPEPGAVVPQEPAGSRAVIAALKMMKHPEGGYFVETDRDPRRVVNPFHPSYDSGMTEVSTKTCFAETSAAESDAKGDQAQQWTALTRSASTSIYYLLTPGRSFGRFHRNKGRTVHTLHKGRARYVVIHADEVVNGLRPKGEARIETYVVGQDVAADERLQWVVEGGKYKASFLLPDDEAEGASAGAAQATSKDGCLISETVIPGFEYADHDFLKPDRLVELVGEERAAELAWLLTKSAE
ncbi:uncharacterized protein BKCO1_6200055 [Diplodia corticola]|uniref:DUF985 domain-containing protein n=1 Tax=Diplodia corticola TaxID=236234 RepID=A0A1J9RR33_9PEZI|nr:uncharacterized protein BKCO1_6200055 [Diplodia corticola]OJD30356.1 hypothetical protein BKCO1_6200055 [Diplodia corticola]